MSFTTRTDHRMTKIANRGPKPPPKTKKYQTKPKDNRKIAKLKQNRDDRVYYISKSTGEILYHRT